MFNDKLDFSDLWERYFKILKRIIQKKKVENNPLWPFMHSCLENHISVNHRLFIQHLSQFHHT